MKYDLIFNGIRLGEYDMHPEEVVEEAQSRCIDKGMNYIEIDLNKSPVPAEEYILDLVKFLADNKVYFVLNANKNRCDPCIDNGLSEKIKKTAGEYYLGHEFSEVGTRFACKASGYGNHPSEIYAESMTEGKRTLIAEANRVAMEASLGGAVKVSATEPTGMVTYIAECESIDRPILEVMCGNSEIMIPMVRGAQRAFNKELFGTYVAHEWYGGTGNFDILKRKRLKIAYDYSYISGSRLFILESGDLFLESHDVHNYERRTVDDSEVCENYRKVIADFAQLVKSDKRPEGGPRVKFAFVQGNLDGYSPWRAGSSLYNQWSNPDFGYGSPEFSWRILDELSSKRGWGDVHNFGEEDLSLAPAYGMYDIIPATASAEAMKRYDYLVFVGWNTMTDEIYNNLVEFVRSGGVLLMCAAHLNTSDKRNGEMSLVNRGDVRELFGCTLDAENSYYVNDGYRFNESIVEGVRYPVSREFDPLFSYGYANYARAELSDGVVSGMLTQRFVFNESDLKKPAVIEKKLGQGHAILHTGLDYPSGALYPVYRMLVRELIQTSHRKSDIKVTSADKVRFSVYEGNKVYLLNTDFDCKSYAKVTHGDNSVELLLEPCELKIIESI